MLLAFFAGALRAMHIDHEIKLDFKDVLIRPKRSALPSRAEVDVTRKFEFKHSPNRYHGIPVIASNMDTVGTFEMARALAPVVRLLGLAERLVAPSGACWFPKGRGVEAELADAAPAWSMTVERWPSWSDSNAASAMTMLRGTEISTAHEVSTRPILIGE